MAQLQAFQAAQDAAEELETERRRRERLNAIVAARRQGRQMYNDRMAGMTALSDGGASLRMRVHTLYAP